MIAANNIKSLKSPCAKTSMRDKSPVESNIILINTIKSWWHSYNKNQLDYILIAPFIHGAAMATRTSKPDEIDDLLFLIEILQILEKAKNG